MIPDHTIDQILQNFAYLEARLSEVSAPDELASLSRDYAALKPVVEQAQSYRAMVASISDAEAMLEDPEMKDLATEELEALRADLPETEHAMMLALLPKDAADAKPAILEIRPGTGGDEAALFAGDLYRMYQRFADTRGWKIEILEQSVTRDSNLKAVFIGFNVFQVQSPVGAFTHQRLRSPFCQRRKIWISKSQMRIFGLIQCEPPVQGGSM